MNRQWRAIIDALERQGIAIDIAKAGSCVEENLPKVGLRFDRVALRFVENLQASLHTVIPDGKALVLAITAPIRLPGKTAAIVDGKVTRALTRHRAALEIRESVHGNRICARLLQIRLPGNESVIVFVHNRASDPEVLFVATQALLRYAATTP